MILKSGNRFSEKIMLQQRSWIRMTFQRDFFLIQGALKTERKP
jgi:hypothetical protein